MMSSRRREFHRLRVTIVGSDPEIWRTFDIDASLSLRELHDALQIIVGWRMSHLHMFTDVDPLEQLQGFARIGRAPRRWIESDPFNDGPEGEPEERTTIREAFAHDQPLFYEYDFGDGWTHRIDLIERGAMSPDEPAVTVVRGENRAPYEDSGGIGGYDEMQEILSDPTRADHDRIVTWVHDTVGPWTSADPSFFDPDLVQRELDLRFPSTEAHVHDMSGLLTGDGAGPLIEASPIVDLAARLPVPVRIELRAHLHRTGVLRLDEPDLDARSSMMAPFRWLIETVGVEGLALTTAGWMPPAVVLDGMQTLGWDEDWIGAANREDITWPMRHFRASAQRMGIVRPLKGRLVLGADAKKALADPDRLWRLVASRVLRGLSDAETDAATLRLLSIADGTTDHRQADKAIAYGLEMLGWSPRDGGVLASGVIFELTGPVDRLLEALSVLPVRWSRRGGAPTVEAQAFAREALR